MVRNLNDLEDLAILTDARAAIGDRAGTLTLDQHGDYQEEGERKIKPKNALKISKARLKKRVSSDCFMGKDGGRKKRKDEGDRGIGKGEGEREEEG